MTTKYKTPEEYIKALENALLACSHVIEDANWGWDGDCGVGIEIDTIIENVLSDGTYNG